MPNTIIEEYLKLVNFATQLFVLYFDVFPIKHMSFVLLFRLINLFLYFFSVLSDYSSRVHFFNMDVFVFTILKLLRMNSFEHE